MGYLAVLGAGSWGTTLAVLLAEKDYDVALWVYEEDLAKEMRKTRANSIFLPDVHLPNNIKISPDIKDVLKKARYIVNAVPTQHTRAVLQRALPHIKGDMAFVSVSKGIEKGTHLTVSSIIGEVTGLPTLALSGPSFAREVARKLPTAVTLASENYSLCLLLQEIFTTSRFRVYTHSDVLGVEIGGALKNVIAIAAGISDGLGLGNNARAALITRGLAEMTRLGVMMGASENTFSGLSGLGDLVLTCTSDLSRNYTTGYRLAKGEKLRDILSKTKSVAEGVETSASAFELARLHNVDMPIVEQIYRVIYEEKSPGEAAHDLMNRTLKAEFY
jgi:glycerol-3-phosphate dehydrogenase (NAD(P)+)